MAMLLQIGQFLLDHGMEMVSAVVGVLSALIALFLLIPGEQPEKSLQWCVDLLKNISKK